MKRSLSAFLICLGLSILAACTSSKASPKIKIYFEYEAQVELISPQGTRVLIDVYSPDSLSSPATSQDILLTTHTDRDHYNKDFQAAFPGQQLFTRVGTIQQSDVSIQSIASVHRPSDTPQPENGSDYIYVIEMGGLRIAHFGDIGQDALTAEQLATLGKIDIAITQFNNPYSDMDANNQKGFNLMDQVHPRLIIPTHDDASTVAIEGEKWATLYSDKAFVSVGSRDLTDKTRVIYLGMLAETYAKITHATKVDW